MDRARIPPELDNEFWQRVFAAGGARPAWTPTARCLRIPFDRADVREVLCIGRWEGDGCCIVQLANGAFRGHRRFALVRGSNWVGSIPSGLVSSCLRPLVAELSHDERRHIEWRRGPRRWLPVLRALAQVG